MSEAVIIEAVRTPFGRRGGALREQRPDSLLAHALEGPRAARGHRSGKDRGRGGRHGDAGGEQGANPGRLGVLLAGFPVKVPGVSLNRMCGSSQQAVHFAAQAVAAGDMDYVDRLRRGEHDARADVPRHQPGARRRARLRGAQPGTVRSSTS